MIGNLHTAVRRSALIEICARWHLPEEVAKLALGETGAKIEDTDFQEVAATLFGRLTESRVQPVKSLGLAYASAYCDVRLALTVLAHYMADWRLKVGPREERVAQGDQIFIPLAERLGVWGIARNISDSIAEAVFDKSERFAVEQLLDERSVAARETQANIGMSLRKEGVRRFRLTHAPSHASTLLRRASAAFGIDSLEQVLRFDVVVPEEEDEAARSWLQRNTHRVVAVHRPNGYCVRQGELSWTGKNGRFAIKIRIATERQDRRNRLGILADLERGLWIKERKKTRKGSAPPFNTRAVVFRDLDTLFGLEGSESEVGIFSKDGELIVLPEEARVLDLIFAVHKDLGTRYASCLINGEAAALEDSLEHWDVIDIATSDRLVDPDLLCSWMSIQCLDSTQRALRRALILSLIGKTEITSTKGDPDSVSRSDRSSTASSTELERVGRYFLRGTLLRFASKNSFWPDDSLLKFAEARAARLWGHYSGKRSEKLRFEMLKAVASQPALASDLAGGALASLSQVRIEETQKCVEARIDQLCFHCRPWIGEEVFGEVTLDRHGLPEKVIRIHREDREREWPCQAWVKHRTRLSWVHRETPGVCEEIQLEVYDRAGLLWELLGRIRKKASIRRLSAETFGTGARIQMQLLAARPVMSEIKKKLSSHPSVEVVKRRTPSPSKLPGFDLGPVTGDAFVGRVRQLERATDTLLETRHWGVLVEGPKRIGKTSLIAEVGRQLSERDGIIVCHIKWPLIRPPEVLKRLLRKTAEALDCSDSVETAPQGLTEFEYAFRSVLSFLGDRTLILVFDETYTLLASADRELEGIWSLLEEVLSRGDKVRMLVSTLTIPDGKGMGAFSQVRARLEPVTLGPFLPAEAENLIRRGTQNEGIQMRPETFRPVLEVTGRHPYYLNILGMHFLGFKRHQPEIALEDIRDICNHFAGVRDVRGRPDYSGGFHDSHGTYFQQMWHECSFEKRESIRRVYAALGAGWDNLALAQTLCEIPPQLRNKAELNFLNENGIVRLEKTRMGWWVPLFGLWLSHPDRRLEYAVNEKGGTQP